MLTELILLALFPLIILHYLRIWRIHRLTKNITGEPIYPFIGNAYMAFGIKTMSDTFRILNAFIDRHVKHGITKFWFGPMFGVGIWDPDFIETIANSPYALNKGPLYYMVLGDVFHGVVIADSGTKWKELRKPIIKSLSKKLFDTDYHQVFVKRSKKYAEYIRQHKLGVEFDLFHTITSLLLDIFSETHLGVQTNEVVDGKFNWVENFDLYFDSNAVLILRCHFYFKKLGEHFSEIGKTLRKSRDEVNKFLQWVLDERVKSYRDCKGSTEYYPDFLLRRAAEKKISPVEIRKELADMVLAGADTSSVVTNSALAFLAMFPDVQAKAFQEQLSIFGHTDRDPTADDLASMTYLRMVIKETLRIIGIPGFFRTASQDIILGKGKYTLPKGTIIYISQRTVHSDPKYWEKPKQFYPEHFLPEKEAERPRYAFIPFGVAPRVCAGFQYGMNSITVILSTVLRNFELQTSMKYENIVYEYKLLLQFLGGYNVKFIERNKT